ncbi:MAG: asparagine synthase (glutamine-hydrolyzing) [Steroidobacteraceae bacterium]
MCGLAAYFSLSGEQPDLGLLARMTDLLAHRGPDDDGLFAEGGYAVGFRRLSIFDLAPSGHQPMLSPDGRYVIVFNGAIYNFLELREQLIGLGHRFRSTSDTEVLLAAYLQWGEQCLERLNGMWAFLIYDRNAQRLFGSRDRFGVKPLYLYRNARALIFASEIKAIRDSGAASLSPDWQTVAHFMLDDRLEDSHRTFYAGVEQIGAGSAFEEVDVSGRMRVWRYWSLPAIDGMVANPVESYGELFDNAIRLRMRSDVSVGVQLSGGLDSTSIISRMARQLATEGHATRDLLAFCYQSPEFDETEQIEATLRQTQATHVPLDAVPGQLWSSIERHLWHQDEPVHSFTSVVGYKLMELARSRDVRVLLNGQGADEVLAGYSNYFYDFWSDLVRAGRIRAARREIDEYAAAHGCSSRDIAAHVLVKSAKQAFSFVPGYAALAQARRRSFIHSNPWVSGEVKSHWQCEPFAVARDLDAVLRSSVESSPLPLYLRIEDRNSMAHGVEVRLPFLDFRLVNLAFRVGSEWKVRGACTKRLLREAMRGQIPEVVRNQVRKFGFPTSVENWFRGPLHEPMRDLMSSRVVREPGLWNNRAVVAALEQHRLGLENHAARLFDVAQLSLWMEGNRNWPGRMAV